MCGKSAYSWKTSPTRRRSGATSMPGAVSSQTSSPGVTRPLSGRSKPGDDAQHGRLAGAGRAHQGQRLAADREVYREAERAKGMRDVELERHPKNELHA